MSAMQEGVVVGIVREREDEDAQGRVKVEYPWLPGNPLSPWARIAAPLAGKQRGAWFMPEEGDEVLVAFEQNRFDHPYVVGFLWNGVDRPPASDLEHRVIVTPGKHELRFEDGEGSGKVVLKSAGGLTLTLDDGSSAITLEGGGRKIELQGGQVKIT